MYFNIFFVASRLLLKFQKKYGVWLLGVPTCMFTFICIAIVSYYFEWEMVITSGHICIRVVLTRGFGLLGIVA